VCLEISTPVTRRYECTAIRRVFVRRDYQSGLVLRGKAGSDDVKRGHVLNALRQDAQRLSQRIVVAESTSPAYRALIEQLEREGYTVVRVASSTALTEQARDAALCIVDMVVGAVDGLSLIRTLRADGIDAPVIVYATSGADIDCVLAFEVGADDYVLAPRPTRELVCRIRAVLRRSAGKVEESPMLRFGDLEIDERARDARLGGVPMQLRPREFALLLALAKQPGVALSRKTLVDRVWGYDYYGDERTVDSHIRQIRAKLEAQPQTPSFVRTIYGYGYRFEPA